MEFAVVAMPFFLLLTGILVVGFMLFCASTLDYATQKAARQIMVGSVQSGGVSSAQFRSTVLCAYLPAPMFDCSKLVVNLQTVALTAEPTTYKNFVKPDYSGLTMPSPSTQGSYCPGGGGDYEVMEVIYPMPLYLSVFQASSNVVQGQFVLMSTAAFKNEPFQGSSTSYPGC